MISALNRLVEIVEAQPGAELELETLAQIVAVLERADDFSTATVELWLPVERA